MSLLSTSSTTQQDAFLYENHYPQPIIVAPNSQICLQKFIHYRGAFYEVTTQNNTIGFRFGTGGAGQDVPRFVSIPTGSYDATGLAEAFELAMNSVNQQQNYEWQVAYNAPAASGDPDQFQITYISVPTPDPNSGNWNSFDSGQLNISNQGIDNEESSIKYNGSNADHFANVISKRSQLVYLGGSSWSDIQPNKNTQMFQPIQMGLVRNSLSNPANPNPNLQFAPDRYNLALECQGDNMVITYGRQRQGSIKGNPNWFQSDVRRDLQGLYNAVFKANAGVFDPTVKLECIMTIYGTAQTSRRVLIQLLSKGAGESEYTALADGLGGNSPITNTPLVKTLNVGGDTFSGLVFDSNDPSLNDTQSKINQHYPSLSQAPFFPTISFQKAGSRALTGYDLDDETWTNAGGTNTVTFIPLVNNGNGYTWRTEDTATAEPDGLYWLQIDPLNYWCKGGDVPMTDPPLYKVTLDPTGNTNGSWQLRNGSTDAPVGDIFNFSGTSPVPEETDKVTIKAQGTFNTIEPVAGLTGEEGTEEAEEEDAGLGADLASNARLYMRGSGGGVEADVGNLLGFSNNEEDFGGGAQTGASVNSDTDPDQTANNNTLHISIPEMPLVKSFEGENSAEAKSIAIIPREEFSTGDTVGSLVYVAPYENWIDVNNGQELNMNLITTLVRNADGTLADNLVNETQAVFKLRQDPTKREEELKAEKFKEMAEIMANSINTGLTSLISPQQLIGS